MRKFINKNSPGHWWVEDVVLMNIKMCLLSSGEDWWVKVIVDLQITTGYNLEDDRCECVALQDYKENEQVTVAHTLLSLFATQSENTPLLSATDVSSLAKWEESQLKVWRRKRVPCCLALITSGMIRDDSEGLWHSLSCSHSSHTLQTLCKMLH